jgi:hypothetical protein
VHIRMRATALVATGLLALSAGACGGANDDPRATGSPSAALTTATAGAAVDALCRMGSITGVDQARATFYDEAHATLHEIAAAAEAEEIGSDSELLIAMVRVEAELEEASLPPTYEHDIRTLQLATTRTLDAIELDVPGC